MKTTFSTFNICDVRNIPHERLRQWMKKDFIRPTIPAEGQGTRAAFSLPDVYRIEIFKQLIEGGLKREVAAKFISVLKDNDLEENNFILYAIETIKGDVHIYPKCFTDKNSALDHPKQYVWKEIHFLDIENLKKEIDTALSGLD